MGGDSLEEADKSCWERHKSWITILFFVLIILAIAIVIAITIVFIVNAIDLLSYC